MVVMLGEKLSIAVPGWEHLTVVGGVTQSSAAPYAA